VDDALVQPPILDRVSQAIDERLSKAGVSHKLRRIPPADNSWWCLAVDLEEGIVDDRSCALNSDVVAIIPRHQENVSIELATEYVAVCASLMPEKAWWALCRVDERTNLDARRDARRASRVARCAKWASSFRARG